MKVLILNLPKIPPHYRWAAWGTKYVGGSGDKWQSKVLLTIDSTPNVHDELIDQLHDEGFGSVIVCRVVRGDIDALCFDAEEAYETTPQAMNVINSFAEYTIRDVKARIDSANYDTDMAEMADQPSVPVALQRKDVNAGESDTTNDD